MRHYFFILKDNACALVSTQSKAKFEILTTQHNVCGVCLTTQKTHPSPDKRNA